MKNIFFLLVILCCFAPQSNSEWVNGYVRSDGKYVHGYYRTNRDMYKWNNKSYDGDINDRINDKTFYKIYGYDPEPNDDEQVGDVKSLGDIRRSLNRFSTYEPRESNCSYCNGQGYLLCSACNGHGYFLCSTCKGKGLTYQKCLACAGTGQIGAITCLVCSGYGVTSLVCVGCAGSGYFKCTTCSGSGKILCYICRGTGER